MIWFQEEKTVSEGDEHEEQPRAWLAATTITDAASANLTIPDLRGKDYPSLETQGEEREFNECERDGRAQKGTVRVESSVEEEGSSKLSSFRLLICSWLIGSVFTRLSVFPPPRGVLSASQSSGAL